MRSVRRSLTASLVLIAAYAGLPTAGAGAESPQTLRWSLKAGETLRFVYRGEKVQEYRILGRTVTTKTTMVLEQTWVVERVEADGSARVRQTFDRFAVKDSSPTRSAGYDSSSGMTGDPDLSGLFRNSFRPLIGAEFTFTLTPLGRICDVDVPERTLKVFEGHSGPLASAFKQGALSPLNLPLPEGAVEPGAIWTEQALSYRYAGLVERWGKTYARIEITNRPWGKTILRVALFDPAAGRLFGIKEKVVSKKVLEDGPRRAEVIENLTATIERRP